jgi:hypothetical protein
MAAFALPHKGATCGPQQVSQSAVEVGGHLHGYGLGFAQRSNLDIDRFWIDAGVIVGQ